MITPLIDDELAVAPNYLGMTSHLQLITVPINTQTCFELWMPTQGTPLLPEEAMMLIGDRPRLEEIAASLVHCSGAQLIEAKQLELNQTMGYQPIYEWQQIRSKLQQDGLVFDAIGVTCLQEIEPNTLAPAHTTSSTLLSIIWHISFFYLQPINQRYFAKSQPVSLLITSGHPLTEIPQAVLARMT